MSNPLRLTPTSYIVLGLVSAAGEATPYTLKQGVAATVGNFWSVPHAQLYAEPARLAAAGLLEQEVESGGRRRKTYRLSPEGRRALEEWLAQPAGTSTELRDPGLLKLFFGAPARELAAAQREAHERKLADYERMMAAAGELLPDGPRTVLAGGIEHERRFVAFWSDVGRE